MGKESVPGSVFKQSIQKKKYKFLKLMERVFLPYHSNYWFSEIIEIILSKFSCSMNFQFLQVCEIYCQFTFRITPTQHCEILNSFKRLLNGSICRFILYVHNINSKFVDQ